ncbi:MAG TPA: glutathione S-transferase family protein [Caulobacteraceae bacterium]|jgi:glutathione S-transferase|nr:glutathione S-transferase family protein [Caulobacteraceae bacterium]
MITVHSIPGSPFGRAVLATCVEKGAPHRFVAVAPPTLKGPEHTARHPFGRVPAIDDDGFKLYETQAITRYLDAAYGAPRALTPRDPKVEARMNQVIGVIDWYFFAPNSAMTLGFNRVVAPKLGFPVNEEAVTASLPQTKYCIEVLAGFLESSPYMAGDVFSLADIHAGTQFDLLSSAPEAVEMLKGTPIPSWLGRLAARPSFATTTWERVAELAAAA